MEIDTGSFRALSARADAVDAIAADVAELRRILGAQVFEADTAFAAGVALGEARVQGRAAGGRHARPRTGRSGHLRLVSGGGAS